MTKREAEFMGLKYHLGHTGFVKRDQQAVAGGSLTSSMKKMYVTKSSIAMNKLGDLAQITDNITQKLKLMKEESKEAEF